LGEHGINIGRMQFGRKDVGGEAVSILSLDNPLTPEIVRKVESLEGVSKAKFITL
jgi:D-3-phosphoglycerate dehydrogenase